MGWGPAYPGLYGYYCTYADDTCLVVPAANSATQIDEITNTDNNLRLNRAKSKEILFTVRGGRGKPTQPLPPPSLDIERLSTVRVLGVIVNDRLTATDHVDNLLQACSKLLYANCASYATTAYHSHHSMTYSELQPLPNTIGTHRVRTHAELLYPNPNLDL